MVDAKKRAGENERQYIWRIGQMIDKGEISSWKEVAPIINAEWREDESEYRDESAYRKPYQYAKGFYEDVFSGFEEDQYMNELEEQKIALQKERMRLSDQRREFNKLVRKEARTEHLYDVIRETAEKMNKEKPMKFDCFSEVFESEKEAVLCLADWHYGMVTDNIWQKYNVEICRQRVRELVIRTKKYLKLHEVQKLHIVCLGDVAHGAIHSTCRVASEENTVDQLMHVAELIAEAVNELSSCVEDIYVYSTYGNHMRTIQNKADSTHSDNMEKILPWWLAERFADRMDIHIVEADYKEFIWFKAAGYNVCCTHGDLDNFKELGVTLNTLFTKKFGETIDYTFSADKHHLEELERYDIESVLIRSLCGTDDYANEHRLYSSAGQSLFIFDPNYGREATYNIKFKN